MVEEQGRRRTARLDPDTRRGLIADAAEHLLAEHDPLLATFEQVAEAAGVSRALVHAYLGDRRGLVDTVQVRVVGRLDTWVGDGLARARDRPARWRALVQGCCSFVEAERDGWSVLAATGGLDHPALHGVRARWTALLSIDERSDDLGPQAAVAALLLGVGPWVNRGVDPSEIEAALAVTALG